MKYMPLFLSLAFAVPLLATEGEKRDRDPASVLPSEHSGKRANTGDKESADEETMILGGQEELKGNGKSVRATNEAISGEHELETNAVVAEVLAQNPPPTLGRMTIHLSYLLEVRDLGRLALVSRDTRAGLFYHQIWLSRPLKLNLSASCLSHFLTCGYPFKSNPVEVLFDARNRLLIPRNIVRIFEWMILQKTSNLTLDFDGAVDALGGGADAHRHRCSSPRFSNMLELFGSNFYFYQKKMPIITSLCLTHANISECQYPPSFCEAIKTLVQNVRHLTLNAMLICAGDNLFTTLVANPTLYLKNLESLTLCNYGEDYVFFTLMAVPFLKSNLKSLTMRTFFTQSDDDLPKAWPHQLESLELEDVRIYLPEGGGYKAIFLPLSQNKKLKSLVVNGSPFFLEDGGLSQEETRNQQKQALSIVQSLFKHLDTLKLDWWYWYPEYQCGEFPDRII